MLILLPRKKKSNSGILFFKKETFVYYVSAKGDHRPHLLDVCHHTTEGKLHHLNAPFFLLFFLSPSLWSYLVSPPVLPTYRHSTHHRRIYVRIQLCKTRIPYRRIGIRSQPSQRQLPLDHTRKKHFQCSRRLGCRNGWGKHWRVKLKQCKPRRWWTQCHISSCSVAALWSIRTRTLSRQELETANNSSLSNKNYVCCSIMNPAVIQGQI